MLIIALIGGTEDRRESIARQIAKLNPTQSSVLNMRYPTEPKARAGRLRDMICYQNSGFDDKIMILPSVQFEQEAKVLRNMAAVFMVVEGPVNTRVMIRPGDVYVTDHKDGHRHFLNPIAAYSEACQKYRAAGRAA
ncbi:TPA: hypothetical protein ACF33T_004424 [Vibrio parahaemolyticus]